MHITLDKFKAELAEFSKKAAFMKTRDRIATGWRLFGEYFHTVRSDLSQAAQFEKALQQHNRRSPRANVRCLYGVQP